MVRTLRRRCLFCWCQWPEGEDFSECFAKVNGDSWTVYPTVDSEYALLPGGDPYEGPSMNPCWAEFRVGEGEWNPLIGDTTIGLLSPGVAVEYARYDHGGIDWSSAVAIRRFDDFTTLFVDWMVNNEVLVQLWGGDTAPPLTAVELFSAAAAAADRQGGWDAEMDEDESESEEGEEAAERMYYWGSLKLHLPDEIISQVGDRLSARGAHFAATLLRAFEEYDTLDEGWGTPEDIRAHPSGIQIRTSWMGSLGGPSRTGALSVPIRTKSLRAWPRTTPPRTIRGSTPIRALLLSTTPSERTSREIANREGSHYASGRTILNASRNGPDRPCMGLNESKRRWRQADSGLERESDRVSSCGR